MPGTVLSLCVDRLKYSLVAELDKGYMVSQTSAVLLRNLFKKQESKLCIEVNIQDEKIHHNKTEIFLKKAHKHNKHQKIHENSI